MRKLSLFPALFFFTQTIAFGQSNRIGNNGGGEAVRVSETVSIDHLYWNGKFHLGATAMMEGPDTVTISGYTLETDPDDYGGGQNRKIKVTHHLEIRWEKLQASTQAKLYGLRAQAIARAREREARAKSLTPLVPGIPGLDLPAGRTGSVRNTPPPKSLADALGATKAEVARPEIATRPGLGSLPVKGSTKDTPPASVAGAVLVFGGHRYQFVNGNFSWTQAKAKAEAMLGHLAVVTTREENNFLLNCLSGKLGNYQGVWLGAYALNPAAGWRWVTGEPFTFTAWGAGEPNTNQIDRDGTYPYGLDIFRADNEYGERYGWNDSAINGNAWMNQMKGFIVEWDNAATASDPALKVATSTLGAESLAQQTPKEPENVAKVQKKLDRTIIPRLEFKDATIREAVDHLRKKSVEFDLVDEPKTGINIFLKLEGESSVGAPDDGVARPPVRGISGLDSAPAAHGGFAGNSADARITVSLSNIPLIEALKYVTGLANLKFKVQPYGVLIVPVSRNTDVLITKEWTIPPDLIPRKPATGGTGVPDRQDAKEWLMSNGMEFNGRASAVYILTTNRLIVRNTQDQIDLVDAIISKASNK